MTEQAFADRLVEATDSKRSRVVVGLDPQLAGIPEDVKLKQTQVYGHTVEAVAASIVSFNRRLIDAMTDCVVAVKLQIAFYEQYGHLGIKAFEDTLRYAKECGLLVLTDAKRNDIGSTAAAYSGAHIGRVDFWQGSTVPSFDSDALTVNPYLGTDGIHPFVEDAKTYGKGVFVLVRTSNPSAGEIQDLETADSRKVFQVVAELVNRWGEGTEGATGYRCVGAVVGATYPDEAALLRKMMPRVVFLVPGYGAQGATAQDVVSCFNVGGNGAIVNSSRGIIFAWKRSPWRERFTESQFDLAARAAARDMRDAVNLALQEAGLL